VISPAGRVISNIEYAAPKLMRESSCELQV
jgi:hypothetical protein